jgi:VWFA-related protein
MRFKSIPVMICILAGCFIARAQSDDEVIKVDSSIVVLNISVTDASGNAVTGLSSKLFKVFEDGKEREIGLFGAEELPFAAAILIDASGSMERRISLARSAAIEFLSGLQGDYQLAV